MIRFRFGVAALGVVALASSMMAAQAPAEGQAPGGGQRAAGPPPAPPKNLQVLPKDMPAAQVVTIMRNITTALGVQCGYCHVFEGAGNPANDMAAARAKTAATRLLLRM